jgi:hypothetical protein
MDGRVKPGHDDDGGRTMELLGSLGGNPIPSHENLGSIRRAKVCGLPRGGHLKYRFAPSAEGLARRGKIA